MHRHFYFGVLIGVGVGIYVVPMVKASRAAKKG